MRGSRGKELEVGSRGNFDQGVLVHNGSQVEECSSTSWVQGVGKARFLGRAVRWSQV